MKTTAIISSAFFAVSLTAAAAYADSAMPKIPGSETVTEQQNAQERANVAANPGNGTATDVRPDTIVPGNSTERQMQNADERNAVAAGEDTMTTGAMTSDDANANSDVLVPGSGATFLTGNEPQSMKGQVLQDSATTDAVK
ncbi:hypothetical protein LQ948_02165 [Jiella sp. MQZ9-1]|uniref:Uncharacterized protein n=1 Tax=Jiella flava TaxID=2816857 RepID=A0A939JQY8_9HYPH|nr:hypothetical protein [Jiella flava]MBO0661368.1 hypothetical protein [Jiella flava]MCD2470013.1 hypothetical protein [Jiella flava]